MDFLKQDQQNQQEDDDQVRQLIFLAFSIYIILGTILMLFLINKINQKYWLQISNQISQLQDQSTSGPLSTNVNFMMSSSELQLMDLSSKNNEEDGNWYNTEIKEHMFDKVVTPSDVGKLNRLVIPKQYAERYFPLDSSKNEKGLLLNFEDRNGKRWRFRYSYWNSSQSYVMTKGWSRFVKEKKLNAGDTVSFHRGAGGSSGKEYHMFIDWRRRPVLLQTYNNMINPTLRPLQFLTDHYNQQRYFNAQSVSWGSRTDNRSFYSLPISLMSHQQHMQCLNFNHHHEHLHQQYHLVVEESQRGGWPVLVGDVKSSSNSTSTSTTSPNSSKRLRLFGVNMEYSRPREEDPDVKITMATSPNASPTEKGKSTCLSIDMDS